MSEGKYVTHEEMEKMKVQLEKDLLKAVSEQEKDLITAVKQLEKNLLTKKEFYEYMDALKDRWRDNGKAVTPQEAAYGSIPHEAWFDNDVKQSLIKLLIGALLALAGVGAGIAAAMGLLQ